jgi:hypothetical protein
MTVLPVPSSRHQLATLDLEFKLYEETRIITVREFLTMNRRLP